METPLFLYIYTHIRLFSLNSRAATQIHAPVNRGSGRILDANGGALLAWPRQYVENKLIQKHGFDYYNVFDDC